MKKLFGMVLTLIVVLSSALYIHHLRQRSAVDKRGNLQDELIHLQEDYEVRCWTHELGVARSEQLISNHSNSARPSKNNR